jgi:uncharacterized membrane protein YhaH (DUF805 family)
MHYIIDVFKKYAVFTGRASRPEFWYFILAWTILFVLAIPIIGVVLTLVAIASLIPQLAVGARRLHDIGKSGWNQLWALTGVGVILLIIWWAKEGDPGENQYGPSPLIED